MDNINSENLPEDGDAAVKMSFSGKLDNFWYHYKWHTIVSIFVLIVICVCTFQMCNRESYDAYIMYSGGKGISKTSENSDQLKIMSSLAVVCPDFDGNGHKSPLFQSYLTPSDEEYAENLKGQGLESIINSDKQSFNQAMIGSQEYYLCFLSASNFAAFDGPVKNGAYPLISLSELTSDTSKLTPSKRGIYLSETDFYKLPGIKVLPEDTVICIRQIGVGGDEENFERAKTILKNILSYEYEE